jgi:hypothetical protein
VRLELSGEFERRRTQMNYTGGDLALVKASSAAQLRAMGVRS